MSWNNGGSGNSGSGGDGKDGKSGGQGPQNPWGSPGGARPPGNGGGDNDGPVRGPWGNPGGGNRGGPFGGGGGGGGNRGGGGGPDIDEVIARAQAFLRGFVPGGGGPNGPSGGGGMSVGPLASGRVLALIAVVAVGGWLSSGFYRIQPDEQGVVLRFGAYDRTTFPGLNYHIPWPVEAVFKPAVTRINRVEVGYRTVGTGDLRGPRGTNANVRDVIEESLMLTGDENIIDIDCAVFWRIRDASNYLFNTRNAANTVKSAAESVMREVIGRTPIQPALTDARAAVEAAVLRGVQAILDQYGAGVEITQIQLQKVDPPAAVIESFRDVQRANTDADRVRNEAESYRNDIVPRARGESARLVAEAEGARQVSITASTGEAQRFLSVLRAYQVSKEVTMERLYIETMQEVLTSTPSVIVDDKLQGIVPYLPLGEVNRPPARSTAPAAPTGAPR